MANFFAKDKYLRKRNLDKINTYKRLKSFIYRVLISKLVQNKLLAESKFYILTIQ
jgi:hypothetical protein